MTSPSQSSITVKGTSNSESVLVGTTSVLHLEAAMQELGDGLAVPLSREMDLLYDPLESEGGTGITSQNEAYTMITEYVVSSLSQAVSRCMDAQFF